ncbi:MAG: glycoside hydrolase [Desulfobacterales bacterium]|nr:glycoside hydrolase [Desulfobacterales bacterium]
MSIKKQYLKSRPMCKVTFKLPKGEANGAKSVNVVGEFNNWNVRATPMKSLKKGGFTATVALKVDKEYQFRYLMDKKNWENDGTADKYVRSDYGDCDNSVVVI